MMQLGAIGQIATAVKDLSRAVGFYRDTLGLTFLFQVPPGLAFFDCGGVRLMIEVPPDTEFDHHELWMAFFRDGEGNTLALMHEKRG
jgi:methylmalonyl-CoA/ethylmalonyl-CoA epimerase